MKPVHVAAAMLGLLLAGGVVLAAGDDEAAPAAASIVVVPGTAPTVVAHRPRVPMPVAPAPAPAVEPPTAEHAIPAFEVADDAAMPTDGEEDVVAAHPGAQIP